MDVLTNPIDFEKIFEKLKIDKKIRAENLNTEDFLKIVENI